MPITKYITGGRPQRYKNLRMFNNECPSRGVRGNLCTLKRVRRNEDGSGLAIVKSEPGPIRGRKGGTWVLHFASYSVMKRHLKKRVDAAAGQLDGSRKRRKRSRRR